MLRQLSLAAILLATAAPLAHAQDANDYDGDRYERPADREDGPPPRPEMRERKDDDRGDENRMRDVRHGDRWARSDADERPDPRKDDRDRDRGDRPGPRGPHGPEGRRGPPPPPPKAGFEIRLGEGRAIRVDCGDEMIADCVDASQPILDAVAKMVGPAGLAGEGDRVPPPPRSLVDGATPPAPAAGADAPTPPPAAGGTTPPAPAN
ncbi:hypothetical protein [Aureimonas sp. AU12]|uniref:hypothetical protein n=1 Tax=Aureimonas sp. AU12 TaxID=1638161 RepID=UPI000780610B|nr:hypothetical protein [Aureimonas sp. AU12]